MNEGLVAFLVPVALGLLVILAGLCIRVFGFARRIIAWFLLQTYAAHSDNEPLNGTAPARDLHAEAGKVFVTLLILKRSKAYLIGVRMRYSKRGFPSTPMGGLEALIDGHDCSPPWDGGVELQSGVSRMRFTQYFLPDPDDASDPNDASPWQEHYAYGDLEIDLSMYVDDPRMFGRLIPGPGIVVVKLAGKLEPGGRWDLRSSRVEVI
jgi:hypothetical protein